MDQISIVIVTYKDRPEELQQAVDSCLDQEGVKVQLIIAAPEGDAALVYGESRGLQTVVSPQASLFHQLNLALPLLEGEWYACFSGNDVMLPTKSLREIRTCQKLKGEICYSNFWQVDANLKGRKLIKCRSAFSFRHLLQGNFVTDISTMSRRIVEEYSPFREEFKNHAQWDFWLRVAKREPSVFVHNLQPEFLYRVSRRSVHVRRKKDPNLKVESNRLKLQMLRSHGR